MPYKIFEAGGYESILPKRFDLLIQKYLPLKCRYFTMVNVKYVATFENLDSKFFTLERNDVAKIYKYTGPTQRLFLVNCIIPSSSFEEAIKNIIDEKFDPLKNAVVEIKNNESIINALKNNKSNNSIAKILIYSNNYIKIHVDAKEPTFLVLADSYYPGWKAFIDRKETKIYPTNILFRGIFVNKGIHVIEFKYIPYTFYIGTAVSIFALILLLILLLL
jgi:uncharacterized membrane protein YfhO